MYLALTLWKLPTMPRLKIDQNLSIVFVWTAPITYYLRWWSTVWWLYSVNPLVRVHRDY